VGEQRPESQAAAVAIADLRRGYKILTHDWRPPIQGGAPVCAGMLPFTLPTVTLDTSDNECGQQGGYHYCASLRDAAALAGFWPNGRPSQCLVVTASDDAIERGTKRRASALTLERLCAEDEIRAAMRELVASWAGAHTDELVAEQWAWYVALGRPVHDAARVEEGLRAALDARGLKWQLKQYDSTRAARAARDAWDAWDARDARAAWDARAARDAWDAWDAWDTRDAWAARDAWDTRDAWAAQASLVVWTTTQLGWLAGYARNSLTVGIRDAYQHGLGIALPTGPNELGWAMDSPEGGGA
jgi:hypothetical protein